MVLDGLELRSELTGLNAEFLSLVLSRKRANILAVLDCTRFGYEGQVQHARLIDEVEDMPKLVVEVDVTKCHIFQRRQWVARVAGEERLELLTIIGVRAVVSIFLARVVSDDLLQELCEDAAEAPHVHSLAVIFF